MSPAAVAAAVVADTNALLWYLGDPGRLSTAAVAALDDAAAAGEAIVVWPRPSSNGATRSTRRR